MDRYDFDKKLAKLNAQLTVVTTTGSIIAIFGASLFILGVTIGLDATSKAEEEIKLFTIIGSVYSQFGIFLFAVGMILLVIIQQQIIRKIDKL